jgi:membrane associated rhomboid family serine protease
MTVASVGFQCPECLKEGNKSVRQARTVYGGRVRGGAAVGAVTKILIGINVVVFIITVSSGANIFNGNPGNSTIYDRFALIPVDVAHGQWYRLFTAAFLHYGLPHIFFNMLALYFVGPQLEAVLGRLRFVGLYVLAGVGGCLLSVAFGPLNEQAAGASGAIFGLFGAIYIVARHLNLQTSGIAVTIAANLVFTFAVSNIDWRGHVGGLIVGSVVALVFAYAPHGPSRSTYQALGVGVVAAVLAAGGFLASHHVDNKCPVLHATRNGVPISCSSDVQGTP